jgi:uncharacterized protein YbaP (TraB family)
MPDLRGAQERRRRGLAALVFATALALGASGAAQAKPPVWVVHSAKATLVLFGSLHLLPDGVDWRPDALNDALTTADELWFEEPITPEAAAISADLQLKRGALPKSQRLSGMLSEDELMRLMVAAVAVHCVPEAIDRLQPWNAELTLSVAEDASSGADASSGVEHQLEAQAPTTAQRRSFETPLEQIEFLAGAPVKDQLASLNLTVTEIVDDPDTYRRVVDEWMAGDLAGLEHDANAPLKRVSPRLYDRLIVKRNRRWADKLARRLRAPGQIVVVVGIGHLIGGEGLPAMLRARGFQVDGPS